MCAGGPLAAETSLLLVELYIATYQLDKASTQIEQVETKLYGQPLNSQGEHEGEPPVVNDQYCSRLHLFKARLHLLNKNVKACKKELKSYSTITGNVSP